MSKLRWLPDSRTIKGGCSSYILLIIVLVVILLSSCYSPKNARKQVAKADASYPEILAEYCRDKFPVIERIVKGDSVFVIDTVIEGEVIIINDTAIINDTVKITKTIPKTITITKTITVTDTVYKENTAALAACAIARDQAIRLATTEKKEKDKWKKRATIYGFSLLGLLLVLLVIGYFKGKTLFTKK